MPGSGDHDTREIRRAVGEIVNRTEQSDYIDEQERIVLRALDALAARVAALEHAAETLRQICDFPINEDMSGGWHFAEVRQIARDALAKADES